jgi:N-acetylglucosamine kinase
MSEHMPRAWHGIDIGGTKIELVTYAEQGAQLQERHRERIATPGHDFAEFMAAIAALVTRADAALGKGKPLRAAVGVGLPGVIDSASGRQVSSNVPALNGRLVAQAMQEALQRPVAIGNDCQCFALSEAQGGAADGLPTMFGAIIGTGAGGGYCVDGRLQRGFNGIAGEWGHWSIPAAQLARNGLPVYDCACGKQGCLERYVSGPGMSRLHAHFGGDGAQPLAIAARAHGAGASETAVHTETVHLDLLGHALAGLVLAYDPHAIVLGGGLSNLPHLYRDLPGAVRRHLFRGVQVPPILPPRFGDAGGARGAALLARQQTMTSIF